MAITTPSPASRSFRLRQFAQRVFACVGAMAIIFWAVSVWQNLGVGIDAVPRPTGWGTSKAVIEASLVRGGVVLIAGGTRTDSVAYDPNTGFSEFRPLGGRVYILDVHTVAGPMVWWPRIEQPAAWSGLYIFFPLWPIVLGCGAVTIWLWTKNRRIVPGACPTCGYVLAGLHTGAACPECGATTVAA